VTIYLLLCLATLATSSTSAQERTDFGAAWRRMDEPQRFLYLLGFSEGTFHATNFVQQITDTTGRAQGPAVRVSTVLGKPERRLIKRLYDVIHEANDPGVRLDGVGRVMADLYQDGANTYIPWFAMVSVAIRKLNGAPAAEIEESLMAKRRVAASRP